MNKDSKFKPAKWANGQPSIDIDPYDYSKAGFETLIEFLNDLLDFDQPKIISGAGKIMTTLDVDGEKVEVDMDDFSCSLAFESEFLRDEVLAALQEMQA